MTIWPVLQVAHLSGLSLCRTAFKPAAAIVLADQNYNRHCKLVLCALGSKTGEISMVAI